MCKEFEKEVEDALRECPFVAEGTFNRKSRIIDTVRWLAQRVSIDDSTIRNLNDAIRDLKDSSKVEPEEKLPEKSGFYWWRIDHDTPWRIVRFIAVEVSGMKLSIDLTGPEPDTERNWNDVLRSGGPVGFWVPIVNPGPKRKLRENLNRD